MYKIPFSQSNIVFETFSATTWDEFRKYFVASMKKAGWKVITGDYYYTFESKSPQGFVARIALQTNLKLYQRNTVAMMATDFKHYLEVGPNIRYQVIINCCQVFISQPGVESSPYGSCFAYSVPLTLDKQPRYVCWGDSYGDSLFISSNPRTNLLDSYFNTKPYILTKWACEATDYVRGEKYPPQILSITAPVGLQYIGKMHQSPTLLYPNSAIGFPALVAWRTINEEYEILPIRGILWDAMVTTHISPMDAMAPDEKGNLWINYTHEYLYGSLWLLTGPYNRFRRSNYAY